MGKQTVVQINPQSAKVFVSTLLFDINAYALANPAKYAEFLQRQMNQGRVSTTENQGGPYNGPTKQNKPKKEGG